MATLALFFVGSVLLVDGLGLLGILSAKATAPLNAFIGIALTASVLFAVVPAASSTPADLDTALSASGFLLFGLTYLYVAINNFASLPGEGLGWYCGWAAIVALFLSFANFDRFNDVKFGSLWIVWAMLFAGFFAVIALGIDWLVRPTGWFTVTLAFTSTTIPGALLLTNRWADTPTSLVVSTHVVVVLVYVGMAVKSKAASSTASQRSASSKPDVAVRV